MESEKIADAITLLAESIKDLSGTLKLMLTKRSCDDRKNEIQRSEIVRAPPTAAHQNELIEMLTEYQKKFGIEEAKKILLESTGVSRLTLVPLERVGELKKNIIRRLGV